MEKSIEGNTGKPYRMVAEEGKIREFARATKSNNPEYGGGGATPSATPVTFLAASAFWQEHDSAPWDDTTLNWQRILHGEQEFVFPGPPPAPGTVLTAQARIERIYEKDGKRGGTMTFAEVVTEFCDEAGTLVAESRSTIIETSKPAEG